MATPAMHRYAAEIFRLQQDSRFVGLAELSESASSSMQATSRMVARMKDMDYLEHELYRGVRLTRKGEQIAMPALRRHRLVEVFLVKVMKYGWDEAHELSDTFALGVNVARTCRCAWPWADHSSAPGPSAPGPAAPASARPAPRAVTTARTAAISSAVASPATTRSVGPVRPGTACDVCGEAASFFALTAGCSRASWAAASRAWSGASVAPGPPRGGSRRAG